MEPLDADMIKTVKELMKKVKYLERESAEMRRGSDIAEAVMTSQKEMAKLWTYTHKRERVQEEGPE